MITRTIGSPAMRDAYAKIRTWLEESGMTCRIDAAGNLRGRFNPAVSDRTLLIGSHVDSVPNGGRYDGILGILLGLATVELAVAKKEMPRLAIEIIGLCEEDGVRFRLPYIGSRALAGDFDSAHLDSTDDQGISLREALAALGGVPHELDGVSLKGDPSIFGYLEAHIEQGPTLEQANASLGVVSAIVGQLRVTVQFGGRAAHAGTVPMDQRKDALAAAAEWISTVESIARESNAKQRKGLVATVGCIQAEPNVGNVIPGQVFLTLDVRHADDELRSAAGWEMREAGLQIAKRRFVSFTWDEIGDVASVYTDKSFSEMLAAAVSESGVAVREMVSGAGHDVVALAPSMPTCLLFIRCRGGISHHPDESVEPADVAIALEVMHNFVQRLSAVS